jgi:hypothetical protein
LITAEDSANAFGHFDEGAGHMSVKELKGVLLDLGEPLSNDEVENSQGRPIIWVNSTALIEGLPIKLLGQLANFGSTL